MSANIKRRAIQELRAVRQELVDIRKDELAYGRLVEWHTKSSRTFQLASANGGIINLGSQLMRHLNGLNVMEDREVLDDARSLMVEMLDRNITQIDRSEVVRPVLEELILKVTDTKLSTLLKEFNAARDTQPNIAAIALRTILMLIIQERAKIHDPASALATKDDLNLTREINEALGNQIFASGEDKQLKRFRDNGPKHMFDNVAHKPGDNALIEKEQLSDVVDWLLNKLLPTITSSETDSKGTPLQQ